MANCVGGRPGRLLMLLRTRLLMLPRATLLTLLRGRVVLARGAAAAPVAAVAASSAFEERLVVVVVAGRCQEPLMSNVSCSMPGFTTLGAV